MSHRDKNDLHSRIQRLEKKVSIQEGTISYLYSKKYLREIDLSTSQINLDLEKMFQVYKESNAYSTYMPLEMFKHAFKIGYAFSKLNPDLKIK